MSGIVLLSERLGPPTEEERRIEAAGGSVRAAPLWTLADISGRGQEADVIILGAVEPFDATALESLPRLQAIVRRGVGVDNVDVDAATRLGICVANVPDASVEEVSDHALALLLAVERRIVSLHTLTTAGRWTDAPAELAGTRAPIRRMSELTLGILGFGRIGRALARKAAGVYGRLIAYDPFPDRDEARRLGVELVNLDSLIADADHLSLHMPMSPDAAHLLNERRLASMRRGAIVVNTARGGLIDERALMRLVAAGHLGGAGLDVAEGEPIGAEDALVGAAGIVLTAHSAMASIAANAALAARSVDAAIELLAGRMPASLVNPEVRRSPVLRIASLAE